MSSIIKGLPAAILFILILAAAGCTPDSPDTTDDKLVVLTSFTVLEDLADMVIQDRADIRVLTPAGAEVHEWEMVPRNFADIESADIIFYNGYEIEQWMDQVHATADSEVPILATAELADASTIPIQTGDLQGNPDPHLWMDPRRAIAYLEVIRDYMITIDPEGETHYQRNTETAAAQLEQLYTEMQDIMLSIPREERVLITSEAAFLYFAEAFDFTHDAIWGSNTEEGGTPRQLSRIIERIAATNAPVLFYESTSGDRHARSVAAETGAAVAGPLYVDSVGQPGSTAEDYIQMLRHNARLLAEYLGGEEL
ncbi:MAG: metal ABC transporter solute-binding protein, Zn/Mn family [Spirochaeta sp.]